MFYSIFYQVLFYRAFQPCFWVLFLTLFLIPFIVPRFQKKRKTAQPSARVGFLLCRCAVRFCGVRSLFSCLFCCLLVKRREPERVLRLPPFLLSVVLQVVFYLLFVGRGRVCQVLFFLFRLSSFPLLFVISRNGDASPAVWGVSLCGVFVWFSAVSVGCSVGFYFFNNHCIYFHFFPSLF